MSTCGSGLTGDLISEDRVQDSSLLDLFIATHCSIVLQPNLGQRSNCRA